MRVKGEHIIQNGMLCGNGWDCIDVEVIYDIDDNWKFGTGMYCRERFHNITVGNAYVARMSHAEFINLQCYYLNKKSV